MKTKRILLFLALLGTCFVFIALQNPTLYPSTNKLMPFTAKAAAVIKNLSDEGFSILDTKLLTSDRMDSFSGHIAGAIPGQYMVLALAEASPPSAVFHLGDKFLSEIEKRTYPISNITSWNTKVTKLGSLRFRFSYLEENQIDRIQKLFIIVASK